MAGPRRGGCVTVLVIIAGLVGIVIAALVVIRLIPNHPLIPGEQRCVATAAGRSVAVDTEQARNAAIIAGISVRRGLAARAASIALTTAYQESGLRNLDHGDRDSVGLFQQRPSAGWGSRAKLMDPYYATNRFYDALIKINGWEQEDITKIAQQIQISGYPDAYRQHEQDGRVLASVLTGQSRAAIRCLIRDQLPGDATGLAKALHMTYKIKPQHSGKVIRISASSATLAWSYAQFAVAEARDHGVTAVQVGDKVLRISNRTLSSWKPAGHRISGHAVRITVR